jgi:phosphate transport system permease protein
MSEANQPASGAPAQEAPVAAKRKLSTKPHSRADRVFYGLARGASIGAIVLVVLILVFLLIRSGATFSQQGVNFVTGNTWNGSTNPPVLQIGPMLWGSILIAIIGVIFAVPLSLATAYFIEFMAAKRIARLYIVFH